MLCKRDSNNALAGFLCYGSYRRLSVQALALARLNKERRRTTTKSSAPWLNAVHPRLIDVHQASIIWLNAVHHAPIYGSILCIHGSKMCIRHQYAWFNAVYQASMWLNMAQCCAWINMAQLLCCASTTQ